MKLVETNRTAMRMQRAAVLAGFVLIASPLHAALVEYEVDPVSGRVSKATYPDGTYITYNYDENGNRRSAVITDLGAPTAPGTPSFSSIGATSATASWTPATDNVAVTGYQYRVNSGTWVSVSSSPASLTVLSGATTYTVEVRAKDNANNFGPASSNSFTTLDNGAPTAPGTPTFSSVTATSATASWIAATDNVAVTGYQYSLNGGAWTSNGTSLSVGLSPLTTATGYTFRVRAQDGASNIGPESSNSFTTLDNLSPSAPGTPSFTSIAQNSATASWTAATDNVAVTGYEYSLNGGAWTSNSTSLSINLTGLTAATSYTLQVRAKDAANNTGSASSNSFSTTDTTAPSAPGTPGFSAIAASSATASWAAATDNVAVTSYEYSLNGGAWTSNVASLSVNLTTLSAGTNYSLQVRAKDAANNTGAASSNAFTTVDNVAPSAPGTPGFSSITGTSATASWTAATDNVGVTSYEYSLNGGAWTSNGASLSKNLTGLTPAMGYTLQIRAKDAANNPGSASSNSFNTVDTIAPSAPGTPSFSSVTGNSATASWSAASDNVGVTGYEYRLNAGSWIANASTSVNLTSLSPNTSYTFEVRAKDAANNPGSATSNSFTTPVAITIANRNVSTSGSPFVTSASYGLTSAGDIVTTPVIQTGGTNDVGDWLSPKSGMGNFQVRRSAGNCNGPAINQWIVLTNSPSWSITAGGSPHASASCSMTIEISAVANPSVILGSANIGLSASH
jgi:chitodextrinase